MSEGRYDPASSNATFATIMARLNQQDRDAHEARTDMKDMLKEIRDQTTITNGRVTKLELWRENVTAKIATIVFIASVLAWLVERLFR
jgi:hypothetical protein